MELKKDPEVEGSDYINASFIDVSCSEISSLNHADSLLIHFRVLPSDHQSGMYRCDIAVNGSGRGTVYIGIYETGGTDTILYMSS